MSKTLFVAGIPYDMDDEELKQIFEDYGVVNSARVIMDKETGKSRGFGFVEMSAEAEADEAISRLNGGELAGRTLTVKVAEDKKPAGGGGGSRWKDKGGYNKTSGWKGDRGRH
ncbi:MAG TPA: RNA-binding protein [Puia sp.]|nr:RNA-binding protein [Puia sp.]